MPRRNPDEAVIGGVVTALLASTGVTGLVSTRVYNNVPHNTTYPLVKVTLPTTRRSDTYGCFGAEATVDVDIVSQAFGDLEATRILDQCVRTLDFTRPTLSGHTSLGLRFDETARYSEMVNGIQTRHTVASFTYWTEQSSS
jgi:hypothetical protein